MRALEGAGYTAAERADLGSGVGGDAIFRSEGEYWAIAFRGPVFRLKHSKGLGYIARLLAAPGRELHAVDLSSEGPASPSRSPRRPLVDEGLAVSSLGDAGEILDPKARAAYRARLEELEAEIEEAEAFNDPARVARAQEEAEALRRELAAAFGLGGRARRAGSAAERARVNVRNNIAAALKTIGRHDAELAQHLTKAIRTGMYCCYVSDTVWRTSALAGSEVEEEEANPERVLATLMLVDIVDPIQQSSGLRDHQQRSVLERYDDILRGEIARAGGQFTRRGSRVSATFDVPGDAIRCAVRVLDAAAAAQITARAGVHTGECERRDGEIGGIGVQIASRISALAQAGEVIVSSTVRDLVAGSGIELDDRGFFELEGIPGMWRLFVVSSAVDRKRKKGAAPVGLSLMVVDDHPMWRQTLRTVLEGTGLGIVVAEAPDGEEAVEMAASARPDVVVMDLNLPTVNGVDATRRLLERLPDTKVLVLSSSDERRDVIEVVKAGASGYLVKTAEPAEMVDAVRRISAGELVFPPALAKVVLEEFRRMGSSSSKEQATPKPKRR